VPTLLPAPVSIGRGPGVQLPRLVLSLLSLDEHLVMVGGACYRTTTMTKIRGWSRKNDLNKNTHTKNKIKYIKL